MEQDRGNDQPSTADGCKDVVRQAGCAVRRGASEDSPTTHTHRQVTNADAALASKRFPLLRRLSIISLLAMVITATILILLYRQDQLSEHEKIAAQENEKTAIHLIHLMNGQINDYLAAAVGLDTKTMRAYPGIGAFNATLSTVREHDVLKVKLYNTSGITVFSTIPDDIGGTSRNPGLPRQALAKGTQHKLEFRDTFRTTDRTLINRHILATYVPLTRAEKGIGVMEIYADVTPLFDRIRANTIQIALIITGIFATLYAALFFYARKADLAIAADTRKLAENEARLWTTVNSALDGVISIDAEDRLVGFNPAAASIFGWKKEEVIGQTMAELLIPERYRESHRNGLARYTRTGETRILNRRIEITALRRDGTEFPVELTVTPIHESGKVLFTAYLRDISERKHTEEILLESEKLLRRAQSIAHVGHFKYHPRSGIVEGSDELFRIFGLTKEQFRFSDFADSVHPDDRARDLATIESAINQKSGYEIEHRLLLRDGSIKWIKAIGQFVCALPDDEPQLIGTVQDITERKRDEAELRIAAKAFESQEGMYITDADGVIERVNKAFTETTGYSAEDAIGKTAAILQSGKRDAAFYQTIHETLERDDLWQGEIWNRRKNGEIYPEWQTISAVRGEDGQVSHYVSVFTDISLRKKTEEQIRKLAFYDPLTGLPNRRLLIDRLKQALVTNVRSRRQGALLFIDLDNFKNINDAQGHETGDTMLIEVAARLQTCIRQCDTASRVGGDEFVVLLDDLDLDETIAATQAEAVCEKIRSAIGQIYLLNGHEYHSTASIGITLLRGSLMTADEMLKRADAALHQAKVDGRDTMRFFDPALQALVLARVAMETDLRRAVSEQEQFLLHYQPQVDSSGILNGAEALVRWKHPTRGMVSPAEFIPIAEETGLILPLGHWVLTTACQQLSIWAARPEMAHLTVAVNVSARQFKLPSFVDEVLALVDFFKINPARLKLEITESMLLDNMDDMIAKMSALKAKGINFSLDDFGTGYSSLSYLKRLPIYQLKIDQSFVRDVLTDSNDAAIARTIVALSQSMGLAVIAEGVETEGQRDFLALHGCHNYQGYFFSRPLPAEQFDTFANSMHSSNGQKVMH